MLFVYFRFERIINPDRGSMRELCRRQERRSSVEDTSQNSTAVLEAHIPELRRFARVLLRGDQDRADDLVQDSLERALSHWHQRRSDGNLRNWLYTILYNHFLTEQKRQKRRIWKSIFTEIVEEELPRIEGGQDGVLAYRDLLRGFSELAEEQRSVLFLVAVEDFTYEEMASILGVPIGTVMSRLSRGRERLREYMNGDQPQSRSRRRNEHERRLSVTLFTMPQPTELT
jgi:RNA polymerase sigma factor (sigma-70 family)